MGSGSGLSEDDDIADPPPFLLCRPLWSPCSSLLKMSVGCRGSPAICRSRSSVTCGWVVWRLSCDDTHVSGESPGHASQCGVGLGRRGTFQGSSLAGRVSRYPGLGEHKGSPVPKQPALPCIGMAHSTACRAHTSVSGEAGARVPNHQHAQHSPTHDSEMGVGRPRCLPHGQAPEQDDACSSNCTRWCCCCCCCWVCLAGCRLVLTRSR